MPDRAYRLSPMWMRWQSQNFTVGTMTITLTDNFKESKMSGFDAYFVSDDVSFSVKPKMRPTLNIRATKLQG